MAGRGTSFSCSYLFSPSTNGQPCWLAALFLFPVVSLGLSIRNRQSDIRNVFFESSPYFFFPFAAFFAGPLTESFNALPAVNFGTLFATILISLPV
jgi:hypothetical protein